MDKTDAESNLEAASPLTIAGNVVSTGGSLVKTGSEPLVLELPAGAHSLGQGNDNTGDSAVTALPADGSSPLDGKQTGLQVLEGSLVLKGAGRDKTTLEQTQTTFIGTGWKGETADASLTIEDLTMNQGGAVNRQLSCTSGSRRRRTTMAVTPISRRASRISTDSGITSRSRTRRPRAARRRTSSFIGTTGWSTRRRSPVF